MSKNVVPRTIDKLDMEVIREEYGELPEFIKRPQFDKILEWLLTPKSEREFLNKYCDDIGLSRMTAYHWINHKFTKFYIQQVLSAMTAKDAIDMYEVGLELAKKSPTGKRVYHEVYTPEVFSKRESHGNVNIVINLQKPDVLEAVEVDEDV